MKIQVFRHVRSALAVCNLQPNELDFQSVHIKLRAVCMFPPFVEAWDQLMHDYKPRYSLVDGRIHRVLLIGYHHGNRSACLQGTASDEEGAGGFRQCGCLDP